MTPAKRRRPKGTGGLYQRGDGLWMGVVEFPRKPNGKRDRRPVASKDRAVAQARLDALLAELRFMRLGLR